mmetsp:Transcript_8413/g.23574  ORF Transcript_8413/g.23574 Transcript_8413/m.23574 type:complete len:236 (+) Transcript_8413:210-917(+)
MPSSAITRDTWRTRWRRCWATETAIPPNWSGGCRIRLPPPLLWWAVVRRAVVVVRVRRRREPPADPGAEAGEAAADVGGSSAGSGRSCPPTFCAYLATRRSRVLVAAVEPTSTSTPTSSWRGCCRTSCSPRNCGTIPSSPTWPGGVAVAVAVAVVLQVAELDSPDPDGPREEEEEEPLRLPRPTPSHCWDRRWSTGWGRWGRTPRSASRCSRGSSTTGCTPRPREAVVELGEEGW